MHTGTKKWLIRGGSFAIAGLLLFLAMRGVDLRQVGTALVHANYWWVIPIVAVTLLSHWLRALRWVVLLEVSPRRDGSRGEISKLNTFVSVMIGYMANYAGPRLGEVIRTGGVAKKEGMYFSTVLGTVVVERAIDMVTFALALLSIPLIFIDQIEAVGEMLVRPLQAWVSAQSATILTLGALGITTIILVLIYLLVRAIRHPNTKLGGLYERFGDGFSSIVRTEQPVQIGLLTVGIWICYGLMAYLPFLVLGYDDAYSIGFVGAWGLMLLGAIGVVIPSPGGFGTYHFITIQSLALLYAMPQTEAATYALLTHTGQMMLYLIVGFVSILFFGANLSVTGDDDGAEE